MNLRDVECFIHVAETCNLTQAAHRLQTSAMTVSRRLASLERELGVRLFQRTTRAVSLTSEGDDFLPLAKSMMEAEASARFMFNPGTEGASGLLRITAPSGFGRRTILPLLPGLLAENQKLKIELDLRDDVTDIISQGYDVAIRIAPLKDSSLIARKLADNPRVLCASPEYLAMHGQPQRLADLSQHSCLRITPVPHWMFTRQNETVNFLVDPRFSCSNVEGVRAMCKTGAGIAQLTRIDIQKELARGELCEITLDDATAQALAIWAVLPTRRYQPGRTTLFLDALKEALAVEP